MSEYFIFGLQRSGTNFLQTLITLNFGKSASNRQADSWKHSIDDPKAYVKKMPTIVIHKNPYTWVESISMRNNVDWIKTQNTYPASEKTSKEFTMGPMKMNLTNLIKTYKHFHNNWLNRTDIPNYMVVKYEDLLVEEKRNEILQKISDTFGWEKRQNSWVVPERGSVSQSKDYNETREEYYLDGKPGVLTREHIHEINRVMEIWPIRGMGYEIL